MYSGSNITKRKGIFYTKNGHKIDQQNVIALVPELNKNWGLKYSGKYAFALLQFHGKILEEEKDNLKDLFASMVHDQKCTFSRKFREILKLLVVEKILKDDRPTRETSR